MVRLFRTDHRVDTDVDISSVAFWGQPFHVRDAAFSRLRTERPVSWHPALETPGYPRSKHHEAGFWAVTTAATTRTTARTAAMVEAVVVAVAAVRVALAQAALPSASS